MRTHFSTLLLINAVVTSLAAIAQDHPPMRGAVAMGFDQHATAHHFLLAADGGAIEVAANATNDAVNRDAIREHLREIAAQFRLGVFDKPFATHGEVPPGVPVLQRLHESVSYQYEETSTGARVRIRTSNREALAALHDFLRYQIAEHHTGDPTSIRK